MKSARLILKETAKTLTSIMLSSAVFKKIYWSSFPAYTGTPEMFLSVERNSISFDAALIRVTISRAFAAETVGISTAGIPFSTATRIQYSIALYSSYSIVRYTLLMICSTNAAKASYERNALRSSAGSTDVG